MLEKGKISAFQLGVLLYPTVLATGFLTLPTLTSQYARNDLWLTGFLATLFGFVTIYIATRLHQLYPNQTIIQYGEQIIGKIPGKILAFIYFLYFNHGTGIIIRQYADFVTGNFLFKTPILLIISSITLLCAFTVRGGIELLARSAVIFTPFFILPLLFLLFLIPDLDVYNLFPILSRGLIPVIQATATPQAWVCEFFMMTFFLPSLTDPENAKKWGILSLCAVSLSMTFVNTITLFLLGTDVGNKTYPILVAFRYIGFSYFLENLESFLLAMWVLGNFIKIAVFYYVTVLSFAQCLNLSDYRPIVFPIGILAVLFSLWGIPDYSIFGDHLRYVVPFQIPLMLMLIPLLLLITAVLRKKINAGR
ncbi:GerAB/ArcD/ProY family transporter [Paenibacillus sp. LMG 31456]|uniref:GerAB/ArcD/ProY family transporter n=1 Tax=Paenibacillus foliorum TaxID=2654974 RepID=A0A972H284_9BACL|nr:endospore germination permease [Paenibacillus foliorum]NOU97275.1 GerAB/ArcD/ProY family transporter [Paenibacillus foliorum]